MSTSDDASAPPARVIPPIEPAPPIITAPPSNTDALASPPASASFAASSAARNRARSTAASSSSLTTPPSLSSSSAASAILSPPPSSIERANAGRARLRRLSTILRAGELAPGATTLAEAQNQQYDDSGAEFARIAATSAAAARRRIEAAQQQQQPAAAASARQQQPTTSLTPPSAPMPTTTAVSGHEASESIAISLGASLLDGYGSVSIAGAAAAAGEEAGGATPTSVTFDANGNAGAAIQYRAVTGDEEFDNDLDLGDGSAGGHYNTAQDESEGEDDNDGATLRSTILPELASLSQSASASASAFCRLLPSRLPYYLVCKMKMISIPFFLRPVCSSCIHRFVYLAR
jgi:hypothetical protein